MVALQPAAGVGQGDGRGFGERKGVRCHVVVLQQETPGTTQASRCPTLRRQICTRSRQKPQPSTRNPLRWVQGGPGGGTRTPRRWQPSHFQRERGSASSSGGGCDPLAHCRVPMHGGWAENQRGSERPGSWALSPHPWNPSCPLGPSTHLWSPRVGVRGEPLAGCCAEVLSPPPTSFHVQTQWS